MRTASWVIVRKDSGTAIFETFDRRVAEALNRDKYEVIPIGQYLASLNRKPG